MRKRPSMSRNLKLSSKNLNAVSHLHNVGGVITQPPSPLPDMFRTNTNSAMDTKKQNPVKKKASFGQLQLGRPLVDKTA